MLGDGEEGDGRLALEGPPGADSPRDCLDIKDMGCKADLDLPDAAVVKLEMKDEGPESKGAFEDEGP